MTSISSIKLLNYATHKNTSVSLPARGVVVITGANGAGKSTLLNAVETALYGAPSYGKPGFVTGKFSQVQVITNTVSVKRTKQSGSTKLEFQEGNEPPTKFPTTSKAQEALATFIPPHDAWAGTCVFRSSDAQRFSNATDAQRKSIIEKMAGTAKFDKAYERVRSDRNKKRNELDKAEQRVGLQQQLADKSTTALMHAIDYRDSAAPEMPEGYAPGIIEQMKAEARGYVEAADLLRTELERKRNTCVSAHQAVATHRALIRQLHGDLAEAMAGNCATCGQELPQKADLIASLEERLDDAEDQLDVLEDEASCVRDVRVAAEASLPDQVRALQSQRDELVARGQAFQAYERQVEQAKTKMQELEARISVLKSEAEDHASKLEDAKNDVRNLSLEVQVLEDAAKVLGPTGVRSALLTDTLSGVEQLANTWLRKISPPLVQVKLRVDNDKIKMDVDGAGGGFGYVAASDGEKRRIDLAVLLAFGEYAAASHGLSGSTIWLDECLDGLDKLGVAQLCEVVSSIAEKRCVIVITHHDIVLEHLQPVKHLHVQLDEDGYAFT